MKPRRKHLRQSQVYAMCQVRRGWISLNNKLYKRKWPLIWVFLMKTQLTMRYFLRGKPSSNAYLGMKSVKRVKRETAPSSESAQCILASPPVTSDTIPQLAAHLAHRSLTHIPAAYRPAHPHFPIPAHSFPSCFFEHFTFRLRTYESEAVPIFHGSAPVLNTDVPAETRISTLSPHSPTLRKLFSFQKRLPRSPSCALSFGLCACGHIHAHLHAITKVTLSFNLMAGPIEPLASGLLGLCCGNIHAALWFLSTLSVYHSTLVQTRPTLKPPEPQPQYSWQLNTTPPSGPTASLLRATTA